MPEEDVSARTLGRNRMPDNFGCWADTGLCRTHDVKIEAPVRLVELRI